MRIATLINGLNLGGAETALVRLVGATAGRCHHLVMALNRGGPLAADLRAHGAEVVELGLGRGSLAGPGTLRAAVGALRRFRPDALVAHMYNSALLATLLRPLAARRAPLVWVIHHSLADLSAEASGTRRAIGLCRLLSGRPDRIVYVSARSAEQHAALGFAGGKALVIPNGYDLDRFRPDPAARARLRAEWGFGEDDVVVGHAARVHPMKDHGTLLAAMKAALARNPRLALVACGTGTDALALPAGLHPRTRLLGVRTDIPAVMAACDIGCLSSSHGEAFPNVLAEFLASGVPCVTTDVGDAGIIVGAHGRIVPPRDHIRLAEALLDLASRPRDELRRLGSLGRAEVGSLYAIDLVADRHMALWSQLGTDSAGG